MARVFWSIELSARVVDTLVDIQDNIFWGMSDRVSLVDPHWMHISIKFVSDVSSSNLSRMIYTVSNIVVDYNPFSLYLSDLGVFPDLIKPRVVWVGIKGNVCLLGQLHSQIEHGLDNLGIPKDDFSLTPHITLGRLKNNSTYSDVKNIRKAFSRIEVESKNLVDVGSISLIQSILGSGKPQYRRLIKMPLGCLGSM